MAYTINLDDDFTSAEELQLRKTKKAILEKLRVRFGEYSSRHGWSTTHPVDTQKLSSQRSDHPR